MNFEPRQVDPKSVFYWFREALELSIRRSWTFIIFTLLFCIIYYFPSPINDLLFYLMPTLLGICCIVAECADMDKKIGITLRSKPLNVWLNLLLIGFLPWIFAILEIILFVFFDDIEVKGSVISPLPLPFYLDPCTMLLAFMFVWFLAVGLIIWFIIPLVAVSEFPLKVAFAQVLKAISLNVFIFFLVILITLSSYLAMIFPLIIFPWLAIVTSMMYTSYRHIWFDRGLNEPVTTRINKSNAINV